MSRGSAPKEKESSKLPILPRQYVILSPDQIAAGHKSTWDKLEITGTYLAAYLLLKNLIKIICYE